MITAIILAAGFSTRFHGRKLFFKIGGKEMILSVLDTVLKINFSERILVYHDKRIPPIVPSGVKCIYNNNSKEGISSSIKVALQSAEYHNSYIFFMGDQPFLDTDTVIKIVDSHKKNPDSIIVPLYGQKPGNPVIFPGHFRNDLSSIRGDKGGRSIIETNPDKVKYVEFDSIIAGIDIDTQEDLAKLNIVDKETINNEMS